MHKEYEADRWVYSTRSSNFLARCRMAETAVRLCATSTVALDVDGDYDDGYDYGYYYVADYDCQPVEAYENCIAVDYCQ